VHDITIKQSSCASLSRFEVVSIDIHRPVVVFARDELKADVLTLSTEKNRSDAKNVLAKARLMDDLNDRPAQHACRTIC
jgi:hypothetical protein